MATVLALGGCGGIGRYAVRTLLREPAIERVVIADLDGDRASRFAATCGDRARALRLDVTDDHALRRTVSDCDIVMSAVGPYFRFGLPILRAVLDAGRSYVDACDDPAPTLEMLAETERAQASGATALVGLGITPGVSNLLAVLAARELDAVESLLTGWDLESAMPESVAAEPSAATVHGIEQLTGRILVRRGGADVSERPVRAVDVDYPGLGLRRAYTIGHPEAVTLPRTFPSLRECANVTAARRSTILGIRGLRALVDAGLLSRRRAAWLAERAEPPGGRTPSLEALLAAARRGGRPALPPLWALATGMRAGRPARVAYALLAGPAGGIGGLTGVPLALGAVALAEGRLKTPGVHTPEALLDPASFLDALAPHCAPPRTNGSAIVARTCSWEPGTWVDAMARAIDGRASGPVGDGITSGG